MTGQVRADILIFVVEAGRAGPPRLPEGLSGAGLRVATLAPEGNVVGTSRHAVHHAILPEGRSLSLLGGALCRVAAQCGVRLVIPGDEQAVMIMHALVRRARGRIGGVAVPPAIAASLGPVDQLDASLMKSATLALARSIGVAVPDSVTVADAATAIGVADGMGYPVYLKESFGWAGRGVTRCDDAAAITAAFAATRRAMAPLRALIRRATGRDWYPATSAIDLQRGIAGDAAMVCALAWQGRMIGAVSAEKLAPLESNGPSLAVRVRHDPAMVAASGRMIAALGLTGLVSFDFMMPANGGQPLLIECNPRPVAIHNLGAGAGVDFAALLAACLGGGDLPAAACLADCESRVLLFPHGLDPAWAAEAARRGWQIDLPADEPALIEAMRRRPAEECAPEPDRVLIAA